jgi:hypothetical protein
MPVEALDARTHAFPIPIAGVLGADLLAGQVLDVRPDPCRVRLEPAGGPRSGGLPVALLDGVPYVQAAASDGKRSVSGLFRVSTGSPVVTSALAEGSALRALSVNGQLFENLAAATAATPDANAAGAIGEPVWSHWRMRLDLKRKRLWLAPEPSRTQGR